MLRNDLRFDSATDQANQAICEAIVKIPSKVSIRLRWKIFRVILSNIYEYVGKGKDEKGIKNFGGGNFYGEDNICADHHKQTPH